MWTAPLLALALVLAGQDPTAPPPPDAVVAQVDGHAIKASEVDRLLWEWRGQEVLNELIDTRLIARAAAEAKVSVTEKEVEERLAAQLEQMKPQLPPETTPESYLLAQGFPRDRLLLRIRNEMLVNKMALEGFDVRQFVKVSTIVVPVQSPSAEHLKEGVERAQAVYDRLKKGESWDEVLNSVVTDPAVQRSHGLLGWRQLDAFPPPARQELAALEPGGFTKPVQTQNGFQIFRLDAKSDQLRGQELESVRAMYLQTARMSFMQRLRSEAKIERLWPRRG
ncbi:MAG TPA: peptidylprolyl isomerase [Fimbriimonadaceae bacterium]|nr:peptidylprolyl isomerase [Fimbriimonadaceae bacterium]